MNLQEFVRTALTEIVAGVAEAKEECKKHGASVGSNAVYGHLKEAQIVTDNDGKPVSRVEFDIALAEAKATDPKSGIGVFLGAVGLGAQGTSPSESLSNSRIKFSVPIIFPGDVG